jgi:hypothetical protein
MFKTKKFDRLRCKRRENDEKEDEKFFLLYPGKETTKHEIA